MRVGVYKLRMDVKNKNIFTDMNIRRVGILLVLAIVVVLFFLNRNDVILSKQNNFELHAISAAGDEFKSVIHLHNPNLLSSTIKTIDEKFSINGIQIGEFNMELNQGIPGLKETEFPISIRFNKNDYSKAVHADSTLNERTEVLVEGEITFENLSGKGSIKIHRIETIAVKDL